MATLGSFALLIALALAAYNLFAGTVALRLIATGQPAPISLPEFAAWLPARLREGTICQAGSL